MSVATATRHAALNAGYALLLRLEAYLSPSHPIRAELAQNAWREAWLAGAMRRTPAVAADEEVRELLAAQMRHVRVVRAAEGAMERARTGRERRMRRERAGEDAVRFEEVREGVEESDSDAEEKGSRPAAWADCVGNLEEATGKVDGWFDEMVALLRECRGDGDAAAGHGETVEGEIRDVLGQPKTAHLGMMNVLGWTEEDLRSMGDGDERPATTPDLPGTQWYQLMLESIPHAGRTIEAFHNALHTMKHQNDRHGVPTGDTDALTLVANVATDYERWLMTRLSKISAEVHKQKRRMQADSSYRAEPLKAVLEAFNSFNPTLTNARTGRSMNSFNLQPLQEAIELAAGEQEGASPHVRADYATMVAVHCLLHLLRYARRWRGKSMWLHGNMTRASVHAYRTRAVRSAVGRWMHWSNQTRLALDSAYDNAEELERHSTAARDVLRGLRAPKPPLRRLMELARFGRLWGTGGGRVCEFLSYAAGWARKRDAAKSAATEVIVHHAPAELDYLTATLPDVVRSMVASPQWGQTAVEEMAIRIGKWVVPSLWEWSKRPEDDRPIGTRTILLLHFAKLVERLACMRNRRDTPDVPEFQERTQPELALYLRYAECRERDFRSMTERWQDARSRLIVRVREFVMKHHDAMVARASARAVDQATVILDEVEDKNATAAAALTVLKLHRLLPLDAYANLSSALDDDLEDSVVAYLHNHRYLIIRRAGTLKTEETAELLLRIATPGQELKLALQDLEDGLLLSSDKSSVEYQEHKSIVTHWNGLFRAELILTHVSEIVGPAWLRLQEYVGPSMIQAFDKYCP
ncbi:hypothetical protein SLS58_006437 [Diplodia intermedia]|uniref:Uncharacterized protein n=1 Tax=Diplodia intermedia TaxID=856260 RepID=A0ABR3TMX6_9PEZI